MSIGIIDCKPEYEVTVLTGTDPHAIRREAILAMTHTKPGNDLAWVFADEDETARILRTCPFPTLDDPEDVREWHERFRTADDLPEFALYEPLASDEARPPPTGVSIKHYLD